ncbi:hypothetical protein CRN74_05990 [Yersinia frederiksenii]|nr:hypothetical protein CRN74_05990 [Yersinia frederiksenii]
MLAGKDISLTGKNVAILAAENQSSQTHSVEQKSSGLTLALSDAVGSVLNTAVTTAKDASEESNGRVAALQGVKAALGGAQVSGETVKVDVGRDLLLQSQQDSDNYDSKQTSTSGGVSVAVTGGSSANLSMSQDKLHSNYDSVQEQTGIFAGKGGFDITVGEHTQLDGAVIASTADKSKNSLDTGTLGFSNIENKADFKAEHQGGSLSTGGPVGSDLLSNLGSVVLSGLGNDGHAEGTTQAAIADGTITIRDTDKQQQNVDDLSRDTDNANGSIGPIFDKEKEQNRLREAQLIGEIGGQAMDIARTQGDIIATKAANERMKNVTPEDIAAAEKQWAKANPDKVPTAEDINNQIYQTAYNQAFNESGLGTGGAVQRAMQAATAAVQGLAGGLIGDSTADTVAGAQTGKTVVENNSLSGDQGRESMKQAAESLKNQIRDKLGEGTTSAIANAIITALADTGDTALGGGDYALDYVMALASCATGDSYCTQALNDLAGKNQAAVDTVKALIKSETWSAIAESAKKAYDGDQMALEATGGMLAGLFLPGKKLPDVGAIIVSDNIAFSAKQLDKKFKHAIDFDVVTTKKNPETLKQYEVAIKNHMDDTTTFEKGTYGFVKDSKVFFNPTTNNVVVIDKSGEFITGFKVTPGTPQYDNFMKNGVLR